MVGFEGVRKKNENGVFEEEERKRRRRKGQWKRKKKIEEIEKDTNILAGYMFFTEMQVDGQQSWSSV